MTEKNSQIIFYGNSWCGDCYRAKRTLDSNNIPYTLIDIDKNQQALEFVVTHNNGNRSVPTIVFPDGEILVEPSRQELQTKIQSL